MIGSTLLQLYVQYDGCFEKYEQFKGHYVVIDIVLIHKKMVILKKRSRGAVMSACIFHLILLN
jgi:hypothetical protein